MLRQQDIVPPAPPQTILVVDDEPAVTKLCKATLQQAGFLVLDADGSSEALKICTKREGPIDLLLTDLILPPPGFELASHSNQFPHVHGHELTVRALRMRKGLRVILMSGNVDKDLAGYGIRRWNLPFLHKPFELQALLTLVQQTLHAPPPSTESLTEGQPGVPNVGDEWFD